MVARLFYRHRIPEATLGTRPLEFSGPINFLRVDCDFPVEVSFDNTDFFVMLGGQKISNLGGLARFWLRRGGNVSVGADVVLTYGIAEYDAPDSRLMSPDGRHPLMHSRVSNGAGDLTALMSMYGQAVTPDTWQPHVKDIVAFNEGANPAYIKLAFATALPTPGVTVPFMTFVVPANGALDFKSTHGIRQMSAPFNAIPYIWTTTGIAWNDVAPVSASTLRMCLTLC